MSLNIFFVVITTVFVMAMLLAGMGESGFLLLLCVCFIALVASVASESDARAKQSQPKTECTSPS